MEILKIDQINSLITGIGYVPMVKGSKLAKQRDEVIFKLLKLIETKLDNQPSK